MKSTFEKLKETVDQHLNGSNQKGCIPKWTETKPLTKRLLRLNQKPGIIPWASQPGVITKRIKQRAWIMLIVLKEHKDWLLQQFNDILDKYIVCVGGTDDQFSYHTANLPKPIKNYLATRYTRYKKRNKQLYRWDISRVIYTKPNFWSLQYPNPEIYDRLKDQVYMINILSLESGNNDLFTILANMKIE